MNVDHPAAAWLMVAAVGVVAAIANVLAGGGSLLALPALVFAGLPDTTANGTIRLAVLVQTAVAAARYRRAGRLDLRPLRTLAPPLVLGAVFGAWVGASTGDAAMRVVLTWAMLACAALLVLRPGSASPRAVAPPGSARTPWHVSWPVMLAAGVYGGFVQAGVGLLLLSALALVLGHDLVKANILKVALVLCYAPAAVLLFASQGRVDWEVGVALAAGQVIGAWIGAGLNLRRGARIVRWVVAAVVVLAVVRMWPTGGS